MQMIWMRITNVINPLKGHHQSQVKLLKIKKGEAVRME